MRNFPVLLVALGSLTALAIPAAAESDHGSCATASFSISSATIDLEAIPMMSAAGPKSVKGVGDDECGGGKPVSGARGERQNEELGDSDD